MDLVKEEQKQLSYCFNTFKSDSEWVVVVVLMFHRYHDPKRYFLVKHKLKNSDIGEPFQIDEFPSSLNVQVFDSG